jgi:uncharacterized iron-regulated membrane protein
MCVLTWRRIHRYLGIVVGAQLVLWTAGGLFFSLNPIARVRGETEAAEPPPLTSGQAWASPAAAIQELHAREPGLEIETVLLRPHLTGAVYEIAYRIEGAERRALASASTGRLRGAVTRDEAVKVARDAYSIGSPVADVTLVSEVEAGSEYRGHSLPAYRVTFDDALGTRLYVSVERGVVTARRNDRWRWFDFFWMLHIMDYQDRDDFNTVLLQAASVLGLITILSGFVLAALTSPRLRRAFVRG